MRDWRRKVAIEVVGIVFAAWGAAWPRLIDFFEHDAPESPLRQKARDIGRMLDELCSGLRGAG